MSACVTDDRAVRFLKALNGVPRVGAVACVQIKNGEITVSRATEKNFKSFTRGSPYHATFPHDVRNWNDADMHRMVGTVFQKNELYVVVGEKDITVYYRE